MPSFISAAGKVNSQTAFCCWHRVETSAPCAPPEYAVSVRICELADIDFMARSPLVKAHKLIMTSVVVQFASAQQIIRAQALGDFVGCQDVEHMMSKY